VTNHDDGDDEGVGFNGDEDGDGDGDGGDDNDCGDDDGDPTLPCLTLSYLI